jgi:hypothetical protein
MILVTALVLLLWFFIGTVAFLFNLEKNPGLSVNVTGFDKVLLAPFSLVFWIVSKLKR